jgi:hypothetical protein
MIPLGFFLLGMYLIFAGSYYWALLALFLAISVRFTLVLAFFGVVLFGLSILGGMHGVL